MQADPGSTGGRAVAPAADWYLNNVLDATADELLAIEYICQSFPVPHTTHQSPTNETQDASSSQEHSCIWLVNESSEPVLQISPVHLRYRLLMLGPENQSDDDSHDNGIEHATSPHELIPYPFEYSADRMRQMIHTVRGDSDLQREARAWWALAGNPPANARLRRRNGPCPL